MNRLHIDVSRIATAGDDSIRFARSCSILFECLIDLVKFQLNRALIAQMVTGEDHHFQRYVIVYLAFSLQYSFSFFH
jgi:hypothetical protein